MKKILLFFCFSFFLVSGFSQGILGTLGLKLGPNYSHYLDIVNLESLETRPVLSSHIGLVALIPGPSTKGANYLFQAEVLFSSKSTLTNSKFQGINPESTVELSFISTPFLIKRMFGRFGVLTGVEPAFRVRQRVKGDGNFEKIDIISFGNKFDIGLSGGIDYRMKNVSLSLRYTHGLRDIFDITFTDQNGEPLEDFEGKNYARVYQFSIAYFFL